MLIEQTIDRREVVTTDLAAKDRLVAPILERTKGLARALSPGGVDDRYTRLLDQAGNPSGWTIERILGLKGAALLLGIVLGAFYGKFQIPNSLLFAVGLGAALFFLPDLLVKNLAMRRQEQTSKGLADALDMLSVCVEAGQGFDSALLQVARNVDGPISGEFARVLSEIQIGKSRGEAFSSMGDRVSLPEVKNFITALVQADRLGLPIAGVLREQTVNMRLVRRQKAEEKAQKVTIKILFPLMLCIMPALFIVIIGPGGIRMMQAFGG
ncbi:type II secretion system F family protein [Terrabacter sp. C0L_2]|uniref:type II secretion system F family protein n=1 Tax=Terrabacter sp. C0L_2 TaxID=3108389 RepID=UPI002ED4360F|nr:type II secretion system F family protein [Terrabacter sp. C0L_2]